MRTASRDVARIDIARLSHLARLSVVLLLTTAAASRVLAAPDEDLIPSTGESLASLVTGELKNLAMNAAEARASLGNATEAIVLARRDYWAAFPDGPDVAAARAAYQRRLLSKDAYYLLWHYLEQTIERGDPRLRENIERLVTAVDGGIEPDASNEFAAWAQAVTEQVPYDRFILNPRLLWEAAEREKEKYIAYATRRDIIEYYRGEKSPFRTITEPRRYFMATALYGKLATTPASAAELYDVYVSSFGEANVHAAVADLQALPVSPTRGAGWVIAGTAANPEELPRFLVLPQLVYTRAREARDGRALAHFVLMPPDAARLDALATRRKAAERYKLAVEKYGADRVHGAALEIAEAGRAGRKVDVGELIPIDEAAPIERVKLGLDPQSNSRPERLAVGPDGGLIVLCKTYGKAGPVLSYDTKANPPRMTSIEQPENLPTLRSRQRMNDAITEMIKRLPLETRVSDMGVGDWRAPLSVEGAGGDVILVAGVSVAGSNRETNAVLRIRPDGSHRELYSIKVTEQRLQGSPVVAADGAVYVLQVRAVDAYRRRTSIVRVSQDGKGARVVAEFPADFPDAPASSLVLHPDGRLYGLAQEAQPIGTGRKLGTVLYRLDPASGKMERLYDSLDRRDLPRPVEPIVATSDGSVYCIGDDPRGDRGVIRFTGAITKK